MNKKFIYSLCVFSGTIIGVGLFALPYVTAVVGLGTMLFYFVFLGALVYLIHSFLAEIALQTPDFLRLPGFVNFHLGPKAKKVSLISGSLGLLGAILAYIILGGEFSFALLSPYLGGNELVYVLGYFLIGSLIIFFDTKAVTKVEFWGLILFLATLIFIFIKGLPFFSLDNLLVKAGTSKDLFLPYGVILFSLWGASLIPEAEEILGKDKKLIKKVVFIGILIPALLYISFILIINGILGEEVLKYQSAIPGLQAFFTDGIVSLALFFGIITTFTSFIALGLTLKKILWYDLGVSKNISWALTCFPPLVLYFLGVKDFILIISVVGAIMLAIDGILINLIYRKINPSKSFLACFLILILFLGIVYEIIYFIR